MTTASGLRSERGLRARISPLSATVRLSFWILLAIYAGSRFLQVWRGHLSVVWVVVLHVVPPLLFAILHGAIAYRVRGILVFLGCCLVIGNLMENVGVQIGFPFGRYYFTDLMGPKIFAVPILLGLAYIGMAYVSWGVGQLMLGCTGRRLSGAQLFTLPLLASFVMVAWDLSMDPVWSTIMHAWIWLDGGAYFGVPVSNFFGWFLTVSLILQAFALWTRSHVDEENSLPAAYWRFPVVFYLASAAGNLLLSIPRLGAATVADPAGVRWRIGSITGTSALVSVLVMGAFALAACLQPADRNGEEYIRTGK
jgi:uncharacterized membrane protein